MTVNSSMRSTGSNREPCFSCLSLRDRVVPATFNLDAYVKIWSELPFARLFLNSIVFAVNQRLLVGVGALGFASGPYVELTSSITSLRGSSIATTLVLSTPICAQGTFNMSLGAGIGYSMPRVVASVINTVLSWFGAARIKSTGTIIALPQRQTLVDRRDEIPTGCAGS